MCYRRGHSVHMTGLLSNLKTHKYHVCVSAAVGIKHEQTFQLSYPSIDFFQEQIISIHDKSCVHVIA